MLIGIVAKRTGDEGWVGTREFYTDYFSQMGSVVMIPAMSERNWKEVVSLFSVVVMPGGSDLPPNKYGGIPDRTIGEPDLYLEHFDDVMMTVALRQVPVVVGICRGHQVLAVNHGYGSYYQGDLGSMHPRSFNWDTSSHQVTIYDGVGQNGKPWDKWVNSLHHQAVVIPNDGINSIATARNTRILATAKYGDNHSVVEALEGDHFLSVQWHPEAINDQMVLRWIRTKLAGRWVRPL